LKSKKRQPRLSASSITSSAKRKGLAPEVARYLRPEEIAPVDVKVQEYPNGLRVVSERVTGASSLAVGLWVKVGSRDENLRNNGIAHFIEHVVFKGTAGRTMREIMRSIESRGGYLNAFTTKEHTCFYTWTRTTHLDESVSVLFDLATRPKFSARDIESEKAVVIEEINGLEDEPDELVFDLFEREIFGKHPIAKPIIGTAGTVNSFNSKKLAEFHRKHYGASDIVIVASGSHSHDDLFTAVDRAVRHVSPRISHRAIPVPSFPRTNGTQHNISRASGQQAHLILGRRAPGIHARRHLAINALITIAGVGMSSRLNLRLREELGLAYDAMAFYSAFEDAGAVGFYIATVIDNRERTIREMRRIAKHLVTKPISNAELERAKEQLIGGLVLPMESVTNRMMRSAQNELYFGGYHPIERDVEKIARLTLEEVRDEAARLFEDESALMLVSVVPELEGKTPSK